MKKYLMTMLVMVGFSLTFHAQDLLSPSYGFSHKKTSYIFLKDGSEIKGTLKDLDRKKGLIEEVKIEDGSGKKHKLKPEQISHMYLPPSGLDNVAQGLDMLTDAQKWTDDKLDQDLLSQGYAYFENADVKIKKKELNLMLQLLNPSFSKNVQVYHDPLAKQTMSVGIGPVTAAGGNAKSYFVKTGDDAAFKLEKKNYKEEFKGLWGGCPSLIETFPDMRWSKIKEHILAYSDC